MAEMNIGKHCDFTSCNRLDFLPFKCDFCEGTFCKEHKVPEHHGCTKQVEGEVLPYEGVKSYPCHVEGCENRELTKIKCDHCSNTVCLSHRHQADHNCEMLVVPEERMAKTKEHVQAIIDSKSKAPKKSSGRKSKMTAAKVALMKIKMKAVGDKGIPEIERIYLQVRLPPGGKDTEKPMYFSKKWTIGRIIDEMAKLADIPNNNNVATAKKLRLFDDEHEEMFACDTNLEYYLSNESALVINGGTVVLEYVDG